MYNACSSSIYDITTYTQGTCSHVLNTCLTHKNIACFQHECFIIVSMSLLAGVDKNNLTITLIYINTVDAFCYKNNMSSF